jgi:hypothetical protein
MKGGKLAATSGEVQADRGPDPAGHRRRAGHDARHRHLSRTDSDRTAQRHQSHTTPTRPRQPLAHARRQRQLAFYMQPPATFVFAPTEEQRARGLTPPQTPALPRRRRRVHAIGSCFRASSPSERLGGAAEALARARKRARSGWRPHAGSCGTVHCERRPDERSVRIDWDEDRVGGRSRAVAQVSVGWTSAKLLTAAGGDPG